MFYRSWLYLFLAFWSLSVFACVVPQRVVTGTVGLDELTLRLLKMAAREKSLVGVSYLADNPNYSVSPERFRSIPFRVGSEVESLFAAKPDLAILSSYNRAQFFKQIRAAGIPALQTGSVSSMEDLHKLILQIGKGLCLSRQAGLLWQEVENRVARLKVKVKSRYPKSLRFLLLQPNQVIQGKNTLANDILSEVGLTDAARDLRVTGWAKLQSESLAMLRPEVVVTSGSLSETKKMRALLSGSVYAKKWPALGQNRIFAVSPALFSCSSDYIIEFAEQVLAFLGVLSD